MHKIINSIAAGLLLLAPAMVKAQEHFNCGTEQAIYKLYQEHPEMKEEFLKMERFLDTQKPSKDKDGNTVYIVPVVFHILHTNGTENISDDQVKSAIDILNEDFRKLNADTSQVISAFRSKIADVKVEFRLATTDPNGNCSNGIDRIYTARTNSADDSSKLNPWPREKYLNIWTAKALATGWAGYAYYPSAATGNMIMRDGIMILQDYIGSIGTSTPYKSRALTHEVGHWLDLGHPWNRTINISINVELACGDDGVDDTPITKGHSTCPADLIGSDCNFIDLGIGTLNFDQVTITSGKTDPTPAPNAYELLDYSAMKAAGVGSNSNTNGAFSFNLWKTGAPDGATSPTQLTGLIDTTTYYEFSIDPKNGNSMKLEQLGFKVRRSLNGPRSFALRSSASNFSTNISPQISGSGLSKNVDAVFFNADTDLELGSFYFPVPTQNMEGLLTFRVYAWNAENNNGYFAIDSLYIKGSSGIIENIQNFMEYSYCCRMWTLGQRDRMRVALESPVSGRNNLWSDSNLQATGVTQPRSCPPVPEFYSNAQQICEGGSIQFSSYTNVAKADSIEWTFQGGTPATSKIGIPLVKYTTAGTYNVLLKAWNSSGNLTTTKTAFITVEPSTAGIAGFTEGFESPSTIGNNWTVYDYENDNHTWSWVANAGINNSNALRMNAYGGFKPDKDDITSPIIDARGVGLISFKYAAASRINPSNTGDELTVYLSKDCGLTWQARTKVKGTALYKNPSSNSPFVSDANSVWTEKTVTLSPDYQIDKLQLKFGYASTDSANNLYIDNINLSSVGIAETQEMGEVNLFPNPAKDKIQLDYQLLNSGEVAVEVMNLLGQVVYSQNEGRKEAGDHSVTISRDQNFSSGMYLLQLSSASSKRVLKFSFE